MRNDSSKITEVEFNFYIFDFEACILCTMHTHSLCYFLPLLLPLIHKHAQVQFFAFHILLSLLGVSFLLVKSLIKTHFPQNTSLILLVHTVMKVINTTIAECLLYAIDKWMLRPCETDSRSWQVKGNARYSWDSRHLLFRDDTSPQPPAPAPFSPSYSFSLI